MQIENQDVEFRQAKQANLTSQMIATYAQNQYKFKLQNLNTFKKLVDKFTFSKKIKFIRSLAEKQLYDYQKYFETISARLNSKNQKRQQVQSMDNNQNLQKVKQSLKLEKIILWLSSQLMNNQEKRIVKNNIKIIEFIYLFIIQYCSIEDFFANGFIQEFVEDIKFQNIASYSVEIEILFKVIQLYLLPIEIILKDKSEEPVINIYSGIIMQCKNLKPHEIKSVQYNFQINEPTILKEIYGYLNFNKYYFSLEYLSKKYGQMIIECICQPSPNTELKQQPLSYQVNLAQLYIYQQNNKLESEGLKNISFYKILLDKPQLIISSFNTSLKTFKQLFHYHNIKLIDQFKGLTKFDLFGFLEKHVQGITIPNIQFKSKDSWIGLTYSYFTYFNFNHGPATQEWYVSNQQDNKKFLNLLKKVYGKDFKFIQGMTFLDLDLCVKNGIKITKIIQYKGDIVVFPPGKYFWTKSTGNAISTSWHVLRRNYNLLKITQQSLKNCDSTDIKRLIPYKNIIVQWANKQCGENYLSEKLLIYLHEKLTIWIQKEGKQKNQMQKRFPNKSFENLLINDVESFCQKCFNQFLTFFGIKQQKPYCLQCILKQKNTDSFQINFKYEELYYQFLIKVIGLRIQTQKNYKFSFRQSFLASKHFIGASYNDLKKLQYKQRSNDKILSKYKYVRFALSPEQKFLSIVQKSKNYHDPVAQKQLMKLAQYIRPEKRIEVMEKIRPFFSHLNLSQIALNILRPLKISNPS